MRVLGTTSQGANEEAPVACLLQSIPFSDSAEQVGWTEMPVPGGGNSRWSRALPAPEQALPGPGARLCPLARREAVEGKQIIGMTDDIAGGGANDE